MVETLLSIHDCNTIQCNTDLFSLCREICLPTHRLHKTFNTFKKKKIVCVPYLQLTNNHIWVIPLKNGQNGDIEGKDSTIQSNKFIRFPGDSFGREGRREMLCSLLGIGI